MRSHDMGLQSLELHRRLLLDEVRVGAFAMAIEALCPGRVVADIGSGTGILAVLAARAGAEVVYAVEAGSMVVLIDEMAAANGVADVVQAIQADASDVEFPKPPRVIISETLGNFGVDEGILDILHGLQGKCAPDAIWLPCNVEILLAPVSLPLWTQELQTLRRVAALDLNAIAERCANAVTSWQLQIDDLLGPGVSTGRHKIPGAPSPDELSATLVVERAGAMNAIGSWFRSRLTASIELGNAPGEPPTHWNNLVFPLDPPLAVDAGDEVQAAIYPRTVTDRSMWAWEVRVRDEFRRGDAVHAAPGGLFDLAAQLGWGPAAAAAAAAAAETGE